MAGIIEGASLVEKPVAKLEKWILLPTGLEPEQALLAPNAFMIGYVYGHPKQGDGSQIQTSSIKSCGDDRIETQNTIYELGEPDEGYAEYYPNARERVLQALKG